MAITSSDSSVGVAPPPERPSFWRSLVNHPAGFWFIFWGEFAERCSYYGMRAILATYMVERLGMNRADGGTYVSLFIAACYFLPLVGGFVADNYLGKYKTIVIFSLPYILGHVILGFENQVCLVIALALLAMGSGVIKPNISTLMGLTYDQYRPGQEQLRSNAFAIFYMSINIGAAISQIMVPWIRTTYQSYWLAFLFPAVLMALAFVVFAAGKPFYATEVISRRRKTPEEKRLQWEVVGQVGMLFVLVMFFWAIFDQSASTWIFFADTYMDLHLFGFEVTADQIQSANAFFIVTLLPLSVVMFNTLAKRGYKIRATDKMIGGFAMTALSMVVLGLSGFLAGAKQDAVKLTFKEGELILPTAEGKLKDANPGGAMFGGVRVIATDAKWNEDKKKWEFTAGTIAFADGTVLVIDKGRIDFEKSRGVFAASKLEPKGTLETKFKKGDYPMGADTLVVGKDNAVEVKTGQRTEAPQDKEAPKVTLEDNDWVPPAQRVTAWWQILAFFILTIGEILISVTGLELAFVAAPPTMKSFVTACWLLTVGMANLFINAPVTRLYPHMEPGPYFIMLAGAVVVVIVAFVPLAARFNRGMAAAKAAEEEAKALENGTEAV